MRLGIFAKTFAGSDPLTVLQAAKAAGVAQSDACMAVLIMVRSACLHALALAWGALHAGG